MATAIGSMPHRDVQRALDVVLEAIPDAPIWPQLSARGLLEQMEIQYSEGMPRRVLDVPGCRMHFDTTGDYFDDLAEFYEAYMLAMDPDDGDGDCSALALSASHSAGIPALEARLQALGSKPPFVKVQTTGPCSFALSITDQDKRALFYNEEFRDMVVKALAMKCRWQIQRFAPLAERVICFVDEPILSAFGSSTYISVQRDDVVALLQEMVEAIRADGALAGVHCCGNTEWSILADAGVDIINFDAFGFGETIAMYPGHIRRHVEAGRCLAWGVVPTSPAIREQTIPGLIERYETLAHNLAQRSGLDMDLIRQQTLITPSCGTGSLSQEDAEAVFRLTGQLSRALRARYGY